MSQRAGLMPLQSNTTAEYAEIETVAGVCLVGKKNSGDIQGLCTGTVVSFRESIVLVTSESIIPSKDLAKVKQNSNEWNKGEYVLCFKPRKPKNDLKIYKLEDVTKPNEGVNFDQGLVMIHLDSKKLSVNFKRYRPFKANDKKITDPKPFNDSICQIVNGNSKSFVVESYEITYDNGKEVLRARSTPGASTFDTLSKLTAGGTSRDRLAFGGGIFKDDAFVGVLIFDDDDLGQIVAVQCWLGKLVECFCRKTSVTDGTDVSERNDISSESTVELRSQIVFSDLNSDSANDESLDRGAVLAPPEEDKSQIKGGDPNQKHKGERLDSQAEDVDATRTSCMTKEQQQYQRNIATENEEGRTQAGIDELEVAQSGSKSGTPNAGVSVTEEKDETPATITAGEPAVSTVKKNGYLNEVLKELFQMLHDAEMAKNKTDLSTSLEQIALDKGFIVVDNQGQGNCMFHALSDQLKLVMRISVSHEQLRHAAVDYLGSDEAAALLGGPSDLYPFVSDRYISWEEYLKHMRQCGTDGNHMILAAAANIYKCYIRVLNTQSQEIEIPPQCAVDDSKTLVLGHVPELHYVSLRPKQESTREKSRLAEDETTMEVASPDKYKCKSESKDRKPKHDGKQPYDYKRKNVTENDENRVLSGVTSGMEKPLLPGGNSGSLNKDVERIQAKTSAVDPNESNDDESERQGDVAGKTNKKDSVEAGTSEDKVPTSIDEFASSSVLTGTGEEANGLRLIRLLIDGGTVALRRVFNRYHPAGEFEAFLDCNRSTLLRQWKRSRALSSAQLKKLFPPDGSTPDSKTFDLSLLFFLVRTTCSLHPPSNGWDTMPSPDDFSLEANIVRLKCLRNELLHMDSTCVSDRHFLTQCMEMSAVLIALGLKQAEVDRLKEEPWGGDVRYREAFFELRESNKEVQTELEKLGKRVDNLQDTVQSLNQRPSTMQGVTVDAQGNGRDDGNNNGDGISQGGAMAGSLTTASVEGQDSQKTQIKRRKLDTTPDSPAKTQRNGLPCKDPGIEIRLSNEVVEAFLLAVVRIAVEVIAVVVMVVLVIAVVIVFVYH